MENYGNKTGWTQEQDPVKRDSNQDPNPNGTSDEFEQQLIDDFSHGVSDPNLADGTNSVHLRDKLINSTRRPEEILLSSNFTAFPDDFLVINDVYLTNVPVASIGIESATDVFVGETLRSPAPVIDSEGRQDFILRLSLPFPPGEAQSVKLRRIMSQITKHPFVFIYNNNIKQKLAISEFDTTIFVLEAATLRSTKDTVGLVVLDMQLHYFNHKPFSKHFYYNAKLPGYSITPEYHVSSESEEIDIVDLSGYEGSDFVLSKVAERVINKVREGINNLEKSKKENVPVNMPSESDAWMYFANHLERNVPKLFGEPSDFVGFTLRQYFHFNPPSEEYTEGQGTLQDLLNERYTKIDPLYRPDKWKEALGEKANQATLNSNVNKTAQDRAREQLTKENTEGVSSKKSQLAIYKYKNRELQIDDTAALWLGRMLVGEGFKARGSNSVKKGTYLLWTYVNRFFLWGKRWSSFEMMVRKHSQPINSRWLPGGDKYEEWKGTKYTTAEKVARRQRIRSLGWNQLPNKVRTLVKAFRQGQIPYPKEFMALPRKRPTDFASHNNLSTKHPYGISAGDKEWFFENDNSRSGFVELIPPKDNTELKDSALLFFSNEEEKEDARPKETRQDFINKQAEDNSSPPPKRIKDLKARAEWIWGIKRGQNVQHYDKDSKIRNVFYRDTELNVSSNPSAQSSSDVLSDIVCSSISVSFGHRIAPMRLLSQSHYTYQFLGAGNKSGQMVFVFAGKRGRDSANKLKKMFYDARDNARDFNSLIKDAGSIGLLTTLYGSKEQNVILDLVGIKNVVITNVDEANSPDGADKHQLTIEFIAQDFAEEKLEEKFATTLDSKKRMIQSILEHVVSKPSRLNRTTGDLTNEITPSSKIAGINTSTDRYAGRRYIAVKDVPVWVGRIIAEAAEICQEANDNMPPVTWKVAPKTGMDWTSVYKNWGAKDLLKGKLKNIHIRERNARGMQADINKGLEEVRLRENDPNIKEWGGTAGDAHKESITKELDGIFDKNGSPETNKIHKGVFDVWIGKMNLLASKLQEHLIDGEIMNEYFPGVLENIKQVIAGDISSCYVDIDLPNVPGLENIVPLPPEFYIYDDSHEDPLVSSMTDENNMERFLKRHVETGFASVEHYIGNCFLGGSYISKNLPKILENKASEHERSEGERSFSRYMNYFKNGARTWEPLYNRRGDQDSALSGVKNWQDAVLKNYGSGSDKDQRLSYLNNLVDLSPYIRRGRHWETPLDEKGNSALVKSLYKDAEDSLSFGPNPIYGSVDAALSGSFEEPAKVRVAEGLRNKEAAKLASNDLYGRPVELPGRIAVTPNGDVTFGDTKAEKEANKTSIFGEAYEAGKDLFDADDLGLVGLGIGVLLIPFTATASFVAGVGYASLRLIDRAIDTASAIYTDNVAANYEHAFANVDEGEEAKKIAQAATRTSLGKRKNDLSMRRAYPTFKIFFIEDDSGDSELIEGGVVRAFDDFYSYSAVQEIKITRSRHIASDLAVVRMTNVGGLLLRKRFGDSDKDNPKYGIGAEKQGIHAETEFEHPFEKMVLQDGVKCQIRLGYASNADNLETVFLGQIVEVSTSENGKIIEIMCQGYGAELEAVELGPLEDGPYFLSSQAVLSGSIIQDSIANFGRQDRFESDNPAAMRHKWTGGRGTGFLAGLSPGNILTEWSERGLEKTFNRYQFLNDPQDDNIYAPPPEVYASSWMRFYNNACIYRPLKQTAWKIFKEHELRHPGYISLAVPYGHSPRMTMFFGSKMQHYWSKPPSALEIELSRGAKNEIVKIRKQGLGFLRNGMIKELERLVQKCPELGSALFNDIMTSGSRYDTGFALGELFGRYVPFRNYHYFDSAHHILKNEIRTSVDGTFNEVEIYYTKNENNIIDADAGELRDQTVAEDLLAVKLDENIPESSIRSYKAEYPSCVTVDMAKRYVQGIFGQTLRDAYKGELCVIGDEKVKPYDVCYLNDMSINMTGPIEVEAVTHVFNRDTGFISIITPDLCVEVNDYYTATVFDVTSSAMNMTYADALISPAYGAIKGIGYLGLAAGVKFMTWSQEGAPVLATPLMLGGKPFLSNTLGPNRSSLFTSVLGKWNQYWDDFDDAWRKFDLSEAMFQARLDFTQGVFKFFGEDNVKEAP